jgi:hypothetical protein
MQNRAGTVNFDSARSAIDRHAVAAAAQLLMSAIWLENRVRRVSTRLTMLPSNRTSVVSVVSTPGADQTDRGMLAPASRGD